MQAATEVEETDTRLFPALQLREVLYEVMAHLDNNTIASAARVSSRWSDIALDTLYRRSPELFDLVSILAPIYEVCFSMLSNLSKNCNPTFDLDIVFQRASSLRLGTLHAL